MELMRESSRRRSVLKLVLLLCIASLHLLFICGLIVGACIPSSSLDIRSLVVDFCTQQADPNLIASELTTAGGRRRRLWGPGSYPPRCSGKCGQCTPCTPVHVAVPPGAPVTPTEYYPEAWRCKCGKRLYMP